MDKKQSPVHIKMPGKVESLGSVVDSLAGTMIALGISMGATGAILSGIKADEPIDK